MKMRREAHQHDTIAAREGALRPEDYSLFRSGQRVLTIDGPGRVEAVYDGPYPGSEDYEVTLDGGLGGGRYTASQLVDVLPTTASIEHTAADDYPELGTLLYDRPDPAKLTYTASMSVQAEAEDEDPDTDAPDDLSDMQTTGGVTANWDDEDGDWDDGEEHGSISAPYCPTCNEHHWDDDHSVQPEQGRGYSHDMSRFCGPDCQDDYAEDTRRGLMHGGTQEDRLPGESYKDWQERGYPHKPADEGTCLNCGSRLPQLHQVQVNRGAEHPTGGSQFPEVNYQGHPGHEVATPAEHENREYYRQLKPKPVPMHTLSSLPSLTAAEDYTSYDDPNKVYLRFGHWPKDERSQNNVTGHREEGVSVYDLDKHGEPMDPDPGLDRWHEHDHTCEPDCDLDQWNEDYGNDTGQEMRDRTARAEQARRRGYSDDHPDTGHLVRGEMIGIGHDGEPLLRKVKRVGDWIDHRHLFIPTAEPHRLARDEDDEDYEKPEVQPKARHTAITNSGKWAKETRDAMQEDMQERGHDMQWKGVDLNAKGKAAHYVGECKNCGHSAIAGSGWSSSRGHVTTDARSTTCEGPGNAWKTDMVHELMHQRMNDAVQNFAQNVKHEQDKAWLREQGFTAHKVLGEDYEKPEEQPTHHTASRDEHENLGPVPEDVEQLRQHMMSDHGFTEDQIADLPHNGQDHPIESQHDLEHDLSADRPGGGSMGGGDNEGYEHIHKEHQPEQRSGYAEFPTPKDYHPAWGGSYDYGHLSDPDRYYVPADADPRDLPLSHLSLLATAARDPEFRFHVTAAWSDVQSKAKRIRSQGGVEITHSTDMMVIGNVKGDHHVYETGLQRVPGRRQSVASYSCGCKWGAYHWGADDDLSRFAGRMCSHALALQYEAASRGMFGRDVEVDETRPRWVPRKVVVKYDIDSGKDITARAGLTVPEQSPIIVAMSAHMDDEVMLRRVEAAVNDLFGDSTGQTEPTIQPVLGPTRPPNRDENPATAGPLAGSQPDNWGSIEHDRIFPRVSARDDDPDGAEATLHDEPEGALPETDGSMADGNLTGGGGIGSTERSEDLLLTEGSLHFGTAAGEEPPDWIHEVKDKVDAHASRMGHNLGWRYMGPMKGSSSYVAGYMATCDNPGCQAMRRIPEGATLQERREFKKLGPKHEQAYDIAPSVRIREDEPVDDYKKTMKYFLKKRCPGDQGTTASLWDADTAHGDNNLSTAEDDTLTPEDESVQIHGSRDVDAIVAEFQRTAGGQALMSGRTAAAPFTAAERQELINESPGVQAGNADRLDIEGTHYALIGADGEDEDTWMA